MWVPLAMAGLGAYQGMKNEDRMAKNDKFRKAAIQYSPWTQMGDPGSQQLPGMLQSGLQGAATGAMIGSSLPGGLGGAASQASAPATGANNYANVFGGQDMAGQLGKASPAVGQASAFGVDPSLQASGGPGKWGLMNQPLRY